MKIEVYDTTLRDGAQGREISLTLKDKIKIALLLQDWGISYIEGGWPGANPKDMEFFKALKNEDFSKSKLVAFGSTCRLGNSPKDDFNLNQLLKADTPAVAVFGKSWDLHVKEVLHATLEENLCLIEKSISYLKEAGREVIYDAEHFFDGYLKNKDYALQTLITAAAAGADWIVLCDTNGGILPFEVEKIVNEVKELIKNPIGVHMHNDGELAVANTIMGVKAGAKMVQGTINGLGERCGNADLISIVPNLELKMGYSCIPAGKLKELTSFAYKVADLTGSPLLASKPFVGKAAFAHKGGVHVNAVMKEPKSYEHIEPQTVGNKREIIISEQAGVSNLLYNKIWEFQSEEEARLVLEELKRKEYLGYQFENAEASLVLLREKVLNRYQPSFEVLSFRVLVDKIGTENAYSEAVIKIKVKERVVHTAAEGDGPVNALDNALRKALEEFFPYLKKMYLSDYKVRVLDEDEGTSARVRVLIESSLEGKLFTTVGVSENIVEASLEALTDSMEYALLLNNRKIKSLSLDKSGSKSEDDNC